MAILAIDTSLGAASACIMNDSELLAIETLILQRGHAEVLIPLIDRVVAQVQGSFSALTRVAVTIGPGSFTGLRVGISAARAIGLALDIPVVGVTTLSALLAPLIMRDHNRLWAAAIDAKHDHVYFQAVAPGGRTIIAPAHISLREAVRLLGSGAVTLTGSGALLVAGEARLAGVEAVVDGNAPDPDVVWVARIGLAADPDLSLPKPFYLKSADAKPQEFMRIARR